MFDANWSLGIDCFSEENDENFDGLHFKVLLIIFANFLIFRDYRITHFVSWNFLDKFLISRGFADIFCNFSAAMATNESLDGNYDKGMNQFREIFSFLFRILL